ncbi:hypothetical protein JTE90_008129 [Oedothorax gibbosus]|uniref:C2H2-type domain-containing protein n=1 Tax=Oedothorax gibbosus TaxID=931172 RepID=A0AAV6TY62_9ARAC|nr:hypothetical protein JTE90_008129 [Oedothorax gibbosus]
MWEEVLQEREPKATFHHCSQLSPFISMLRQLKTRYVVGGDKTEPTTTHRPIVLGLKRATDQTPEQAMSINYEKIYDCPETHCSYNTSNLRQFRKHIKVHSTDRPFVCYVCNCQFKRSDILRQHLLTHSGEKPFACDFCHMRFKHRNARNKHRLIHGEGLGE